MGVWTRSRLALLEARRKDEGEEGVGGRQSGSGDQWGGGTRGTGRG